MALSVTKICNLSLSDIGSKRINNYDTDTSPEAIQCRTHYEPIRDALIRSHYWPFAAARSTLTQDATDPDFEWDNQFILPNDFMYLRSIFEDNNEPNRNSRRSHAIEGRRFLTNDSTAKIRYTKKVTDVTEFDPLFVQVLVLQLDLKLITGLAKTDTQLKESIKDDLKLLMPSVRTLSRQEANLEGRETKYTWVDVRATRGGRIDSRLGSA
ncbi:MAG: hypothetical protein KAS32_04470 [Candidatus Peribacteraceae bacterium]|nr:hypothetical protein [Candidatus Peribacteraceae bacterium]